VEAWAKDINFNDMTPQARQVAQLALGTGRLKRVESVDFQGHPIYALTFQAPDASNRYLFLNPDGSYVSNLASTAIVNPAGTPIIAIPTTVPPAPVPSSVPVSSQTVALSQVPTAVQNVVQTELRNGPVGQILQLPNPAGTGAMYEVFFNQANGKQKIIYLNPDGSYVHSR
jgi:hypothetical protein